jgi:hypothetical protein
MSIFSGDFNPDLDGDDYLTDGRDSKNAGELRRAAAFPHYDMPYYHLKQ